MYDKLFDAVNQIVRTYGVAILDDPKFWFILTDTYSFGSDYSLKDTFKECLSRGWVKSLYSLKGKKRKTLNYIRQIVDTENQYNRENLTTSLFAIAIAICSCKKSDYLVFIGQPNNPQQPSVNPKSKRNNPFTWKEWWVLCWLVIGGVFVSFGGTIFYSAFYHGWWLFFIVLFSGIAQLFYCGLLSETITSIRKKLLQDNDTVLSVTLPFLLAMIGNTVLSFFFFFQSFRNWLGNHLSDHPSDEPTFITFILCLISLAVTSWGCFLCMGGDSSNIVKHKFITIIHKRAFKWCFGLTIFGYILLFLYPNISIAVTEYHINQEKKQIEKEYNQILQSNKELQDKRRNKVMDLSFKGVKLGSSYKTDIQTAEALDDFRDGRERYYSIQIDGREDVTKLLSNIDVHWTEQTSEGIYGHLYSCQTSLDNHNISLNIYEYKNLVQMIIIDFSLNEDEFKHLVELYTSKYGEPERMTLSGHPFKEDPKVLYYHKKYYKYYSNDYMENLKNDYVWTYKNGIIRLSAKQIMYISSGFVELLMGEYEDQNKRIKQREIFVSDSIKKEELRIEAIRKQKDYEDSIRKVKNHQNAINDI